MDKSPYRLLRVVVLVVIASATCVSASGQDQSEQHPLLMTIKAKDRSVKAGSPILVDVTVKNISNQSLSFGKEQPIKRDQGGWTYQVDVLDAKGVRSVETTFYRGILGHLTPDERANEELAPGSGFIFLLKPGEMTMDQVDVGRLYDLSRPGVYMIQFRHAGSGKSNAVTVTVTH
jgi:hypothetical protein